MLRFKMNKDKLDMFMEGPGEEVGAQMCTLVYNFLMKIAEDRPVLAMKIGIGISEACKDVCENIVNARKGDPNGRHDENI